MAGSPQYQMLKVDMRARSEVVNGLFFLPHSSFSAQSKRGKVLTTKERNSLIFLSLLGRLEGVPALTTALSNSLSH